MRCAPAAAPQVAASPVVLRLIVVGSVVNNSVEKELEEDLDWIALFISIPGSLLQKARAKFYFPFPVRSSM